ncbi:hypothetical protein BDA96_01G446300 [Sorghum bicolor]|uniref:Uncharacterized protein n=2 Tax=Sorghum bicolor TaxID=4558 RepID=A0A921S431_SORBI|nr:hypothetical protein BDA96_01G446300 [Sorghum bicolor]OQU83118.1 hypothetical protein SORBI_3005G078875 [Sorghum bicolor]
MVAAISRAPVGYKWPSSEKARTTLLDAGPKTYLYTLIVFGMPKWSTSLGCLDIT